MDDNGNFTIRESSASTSDSARSGSSRLKRARSISSATSCTMIEEIQEHPTTASAMISLLNTDMSINQPHILIPGAPQHVFQPKIKRPRTAAVIDLVSDDESQQDEKKPCQNKTRNNQQDIDEAMAWKIHRELNALFSRDREDDIARELAAYRLEENMARQLDRELNSQAANNHQPKNNFQIRGDKKQSQRNTVQPSGGFGIEIEDEIKVIDLDEMDDEDLARDVYREITPELSQRAKLLQIFHKRNLPIEAPWTEMEFLKWHGISIRPGDTLELVGGEFVQIKLMLQNSKTAEIRLRGLLLRRCTSMNGLFETKVNELCFIIEIDNDDPRPHLEQSLVEIGYSDLRKQSFAKLCKPRSLIRTNKPRDRNPYNGYPLVDGCEKKTVESIRDSGTLYVRWKYITHWRNAKDRLNGERSPNKSVTRRIERLEEQECSGRDGMATNLLRALWREDTVLGGSGKMSKAQVLQHIKTAAPKPGRRKPIPGNKDVFLCPLCETSFSHLEDLWFHHRKVHDREEHAIMKDCRSCLQSMIISKNQPRAGTKAYTYADTFSGGGGSTRGAVDTGKLDVKYTMEGDPRFIPTLKSNFLGVNHYCEWSNDFAVRKGDLRVDILHLSPPCQVWSRVYTVEGKNHEMNLASLFSVMAIIEKVKPRIATLEQTFGIMDKRFEQPFNSLVHAFTCLGYSISWQIVRLQELGLPQSRQRLMMVAAGPGEILPDFIPMTHSNDPILRLSPFTTPQSILDDVERYHQNHPNHNLADCYGGSNYKQWDATQITKCITCSGGQNCSHPSGQRSLTHAELARLQGFPAHHTFHGTARRKQIGNAVPPMVHRKLLNWLVEKLEKADEREAAAVASAALAPAVPEVIDLTDD